MPLAGSAPATFATPGRFDQPRSTRLAAVAWRPNRGGCHPLPPLVPADFGSGRFFANLSRVAVISPGGCSASNFFWFFSGSLTLVRFPPPLLKRPRGPLARAFLLFSRDSS